MNKVINGIFALTVLFFAGQRAHAQDASYLEIGKEEQELARMHAEFIQRRDEYAKSHNGAVYMGDPSRGQLSLDLLAQELAKKTDAFRKKMEALNEQQKEQQQNDAKTQEYWKKEEDKAWQELKDSQRQYQEFIKSQK